MAKKKKHTLLKVIGGTALVGGASYMGLGYYMFRNLFDLKNSKLYNSDDKKEIDEELEAFFEHSEKENDFIDSYDGLKLHALRFNNYPDSHKWVILLHGFGSYSKDMVRYIHEAYEREFNVLAIDARGCGMSEGTYTGLGWNEHYDLLGWVNHLVNLDKEAEIALYGINCGGTTVLNALGEYLPDNVKVAVEDGAYSEAKSLVEHAIQRYLKVDGQFLLPAVNVYVKTLLNYSLTEISTNRQLKQSKTPTLFVHGMQDEVIPGSIVFDNYYACNSEKELYTLDDVKCSETSYCEGYFDTVFGFIAKYIA